MPERDHLTTAQVETWYGTSRMISYVPSVLGWRQYIESLNNSGSFVPGTYRCNGNKIFRVVNRCETAEGRQVVSGKEVGIRGDLAAYACGMSVAPSLGYLNPPWDTFLQNEAVNKSYAKITNSDLDVGVMIGELRETVDGLRNPLSALRKEFEWLSKNWNKLLNLEDALRTAGYFKSLRITDSIERITKRVALGGVPRSVDALVGTWLEWRYGIRPLIKQVEDVIEHVKAQERAFSEKMQRRTGKTAVITKSIRSSGSTAAGYIDEIKYSCLITSKTWTVAKTAFTMPYPVTWQQRYGLDYSSLPGIAWELLPLSFVADWFISVGTWLSALRVLAHPAVLHGTSVTMRSDVTIDGWIESVKFGGTTIPLESSGSFKQTIQAMERRCLPPGFNAFTPSLNSRAMELQQQLDSLALTWQRLPNIKNLFLRRN